MQVIAANTHRDHHSLELDNGQLIPSWEGPDRADIIESALRAAGHDFAQEDELDLKLVKRVHDAEYVDFLLSAWQRWAELDDAGPAAMGIAWPARGMNPRRPSDIVGQLGYYSFAADCSIVGGTWAAAAGAGASAQTAVDQLTEEGLSAIYALCRPPGHHASADQFGGYCYLNNAAIAAQRLLDRGSERVAILDVDYHHGNGTQSIFYDRADVLFASIHADPLVEFPWFAGHAEENGTGAGVGRTLNLPLPHGTNFTMWAAALDVALERIDDAGVDSLVVSLGVDTFHADPISQFKLDTTDYTTMASSIAGLGLPTVIVQEGGYAVEAIGTNVVAFLEGFPD